MLNSSMSTIEYVLHIFYNDSLILNQYNNKSVHFFLTFYLQHLLTSFSSFFISQES